MFATAFWYTLGIGLGGFCAFLCIIFILVMLEAIFG